MINNAESDHGLAEDGLDSEAEDDDEAPPAARPTSEPWVW